MKIKDFWNSRINWQRIGKELGNYPSLKKVFTLDILREASDKPPYYCHPLARWFLYENPSPIKVLDGIIDKTSSICGIKEKLEILTNPQNEFWRFWSTRSELSLALYLKDKVQKIELVEEGKNRETDIKVIFKDEVLFFEVYTHQKFYYLLFELQEILDEILSNKGLQVFFLRDKYVKRENIKEDDFKHIAEYCLDKLEDLNYQNQLQKNYRTILYEDKSLNLCIYIENQRVAEQDDNSLLHDRYRHGDENLYFNAMLKEIMVKKRSQLENKHPNVLAVNTLFNVDLQTINWGILNLSSVNLNSIDSLLFFANGIDSDSIAINRIIINNNLAKKIDLFKIINELVI
jgi:hypothetical protein